MRDPVRAALARVNAGLLAADMPPVPVAGQLIRPCLAREVAAQSGAGRPGARFWYAAAAVQMAHEASLVHDDIIDGAALRRGEPSAAARVGLAGALAHGDHLLTTAYSLAARTRSGAFVELFARAVERTVAGEIRQGRAAGAVLALDDYRAIVADKSGALLGAAWAAAPTLAGTSWARRHEEAGRGLGVVYQMLDDLLDYCPAEDGGKDALGDHRNGRWTWPLALLEAPDVLDWPAAEVLAGLHRRGAGGTSVLERGLELLEQEAAAVRSAAAELLPEPAPIHRLLDGWLGAAGKAVRVEAVRHHPPRPRQPAARTWVLNRLATADRGAASMARHARSFRFASVLFPQAERARVAALYAFCRFTDDLVDEGTGRPELRAARLDAWLALARASYHGTPAGHPLLDRPMAEAAAAGIPFRYAEELVAGMRMDLQGTEYRTLAELRVYTYRVAGVVGQWMTEMFGVRDPRVLERAAALGHAMQLTNILRDVGEDLRMGRLYLPRNLLAEHGVDRAALTTALEVGAPLPPRYPAVVEALMAVAETDYAAAFAALPALPPPARSPVAVAARVYEGIHEEIRRNAFDNLRLRAHTGGVRKTLLAAGALRDLVFVAGRQATIPSAVTVPS